MLSRKRLTQSMSIVADHPLERGGASRRLSQLAKWWRQNTLCDALLPWIDRWRWVFFAALVAIYLAGFNGQWRMQPDAALCLSLGRNLAEGRGYTYLGEPHHLVYPGWPTLLAITFKLFGSNRTSNTGALLPQHILILLIAFATIAMVYRLVLLHSGRPTAVVVAIGLGVTKTFYGFGFELWTDLPFTLGVITFFAGVEAIWPTAPKNTSRRARWYDWFLLVGGLGLAYATRPMIWPLLLAVTAAIIWAAYRRRLSRRAVIGAITFASLIAIVAIVTLVRHRAAIAAEFETGYERYVIQQATHPGEALTKVWTQNIPNLLSWAASDTLFQVRFGPFNILLSLFVISLGLSLVRDHRLWGFWFVALLLTITLILPLDRYFLPVIPLLVLSWWQFLVWVNRRFKNGWGNWAFAILLGSAMGVNISKVGGIVMQQHARPFIAHYSHGEFAAIPALAGEIRDHLEPDAIVLIRPPYAAVTAFLTRRYVTNGLGTPPSVLTGKPVYIVERDDENIEQLLHETNLSVGPSIWQSPTDVPQPFQLRLHRTLSAP
jgi:hypothetical protein